MNTYIKFVFNRTKAIQVLWSVTRKARFNLLPDDIMGFLYFIDRYNLKSRGYSITTDEPALTPTGFTLLNLEKILNGTIYQVHECDELSRLEECVIDVAMESFFTREQLHQALQTLPEYKKVTEVTPIDPAEILRITGWSEENIQIIAKEVEEDRYIEDLLNNGR